MPIYHFTDKKAVQLLANKTRRTDISSFELSQSHIELGKYMAYHIIEEFQLEECEIKHPQGIKKGKRLANENNIIILDFLRAGVYYGEGFRFIFQNSPYYHIQPKRKVGILKEELENLPKFHNLDVILVDSVINTGATMFAVINQILAQKPRKLIVSCIVMPDTTAKVINEQYKEIIFYIARISTNKYVGKGKTDTGNRLFGTF